MCANRICVSYYECKFVVDDEYMKKKMTNSEKLGEICIELRMEFR